MEWVKKPILENWEILVKECGNSDDENMRVRVRGDVYGSDRHIPGQRIITGRVEYLNTVSMTLRTRRGDSYRLGKLEEEFAAFAQQNGYKISQIRVTDCFFINTGELH